MDKLDHLGWVVSASFAIGEARFAIRSTSPAFGAWVHETLGAYEVEDVEDFAYSVVVPEPPQDGPREFLILYRGSSAILRTLDPVTLGRALLTDLESFRYPERDEAVFVLTSVAEVRGEAVVIPSTILPDLAKLGRRASRLGVRVPGERAIAIDLETASIRPPDLGLDIRDDSLERLTLALPWSAGDQTFFIERPLAPTVLVLGTTDAVDSFEPVRKARALAALVSGAVNLERVGGVGLRALGRMVEVTPCYRSTWDDPSAILAEIGELIGAGA
jgi:hypothetical protein